MSKNKKRYIMVIDLRKCIGCKTCSVACCTENNVSTESKKWNIVMNVMGGEFPNYERQMIPKACQHCEDAPCVSICPTGASFKYEDGGQVLVNYDKCIGCRGCMNACPYDARVFNWKNPTKTYPNNTAVSSRTIGVVEKCTFCIHKVKQAHKDGKQVGTTITNKDNKSVVSPACIMHCVGDARYFGDVNDTNSEVYQLLKDNKHNVLAQKAGTKPNVYYLGLKEQFQ